MSLGAFESVSEKGLISFGSATVTSNLHQETYAGPEPGITLTFEWTYPFVFDMWLLYLEPTRSHDLTLQNKEFESVGIGPKYSGKGWARDIRRNLGL